MAAFTPYHSTTSELIVFTHDTPETQLQSNGRFFCQRGISFHFYIYLCRIYILFILISIIYNLIVLFIVFIVLFISFSSQPEVLVYYLLCSFNISKFVIQQLAIFLFCFIFIILGDYFITLQWAMSHPQLFSRHIRPVSQQQENGIRSLACLSCSYYVSALFYIIFIYYIQSRVIAYFFWRCLTTNYRFKKYIFLFRQKQLYITQLQPISAVF